MFWLSFPGLEKSESVGNSILKPLRFSFKKGGRGGISLALARLVDFRSRRSSGVEKIFAGKQQEKGEGSMLKTWKSIDQRISLLESGGPRNHRNHFLKHPIYPITGLFPCQANFD